MRRPGTDVEGVEGKEEGSEPREWELKQRKTRRADKV